MKKFRFRYVSNIFIEKHLKSLKRKKSTGLDNLPSNLLKDCASSISNPLTYIINLSLDTCTVPRIWKKAMIIPTFKSGSVSNPENYRPISVLPILSKVLEKVVHTQLMDYLESNKLISNFQFGYRSNRSTELATTLFLDNIRREVNNGKLVGAVFMDLSRAFDTISHSQLLAKLQAYGIRDNELAWFTDYMFERTQLVELNGSRSSEESVFTGVPQGSILGPLLFIVFFNDFVDCLKHSQVIKYADDTVIYFANKDITVIERYMNDDLEQIARFLDDNELIINLKKGKTESVLFGTAKRLSMVNKSFEVLYNHNVIRNVTEYKYLGNIVDSNLALTDDFESKYKKASGRVRLLKTLRPYLSSVAASNVYNMMVTPLLTYCGIINLEHTQSQLDKFMSIDKRARAIVNDNAIKIPSSIEKQIYKRACILVRKSLDYVLCDNFENYFTINKHPKETRNHLLF